MVFSSEPTSRQSSSTDSEISETKVLEPTLVFIDAGITVKQTPKDLANLRAVFKAIVLNQVVVSFKFILLSYLTS